MLRLKKLEKDENRRTRPLYEEIFTEDSKDFVDYYYHCKASENEIYVIEEYDSAREDQDEGEIVSMLHLNPYRLSVCGSEMDCHYIVAVATKERCRHQGMMKKLILTSLGEMYERKEPFTFLMPAAEAIYCPFGFRYMNCRKTAEVKRDRITELSFRGGSQDLTAAEESGRFWCTVAGPGDLEALSSFSGQYLENNYDIYAVRSTQYCERLLKEQVSENGRIVLMKDGSGLAGYFLAPDKAVYPEDGLVEIREPAARKELLGLLLEAAAGWLDSCEKIRLLDFGDDLEYVLAEEYSADTEDVPLMMGRIVHLETLMESLRTKKQVSFYVIVEDELLVQNSGAYYCTLGSTGSSCRRVTHREAREKGAPVVSAARLGEEVFKSKKIFLDETV